MRKMHTPWWLQILVTLTWVGMLTFMVVFILWSQSIYPKEGL